MAAGGCTGACAAATGSGSAAGAAASGVGSGAAGLVGVPSRCRSRKDAMAPPGERTATARCDCSRSWGGGG
eukprot:5363213-Alexandrium_andersonii.AAC.1